MTTARFKFQRDCIAEASGVVLNVGANTDPAGFKDVFGHRLWNCDARAYDPILHHMIQADLYFDCTVAPWPLGENEAELVVLGDILEHLTPGEQHVCLREAHRVAQSLCVTVPNDPRFLSEPNPDVPDASFHITHVTESLLRVLLVTTGWEVTHWETVDYDFVPEGYFVRAIRQGQP